MKGGSDDKSKCTVQAKPGRNGKSIRYKGEWMTPEDFELVNQ